MSAAGFRIPLNAMYSRRLFEAAEAYAAAPQDRSKYDAVVEAAHETANDAIARHEIEERADAPARSLMEE